MKQTTPPTTYTIDAAGKRLGRVASEAALILLGKRDVHMQKHLVSDVEVAITNVDRLLIGERKRAQKTYVRYSGYPGGQKKETLTKVLDTKGYREVLRRAVEGMLPKNRLRALRMKRLRLTDKQA